MSGMMSGMRWRKELWNVTSQWNIDAQFVVMAGLLVVLRDPFPDFARSDPDDRIGIGIVVVRFVEDADS
jgi:hypothetical protein